MPGHPRPPIIAVVLCAVASALACASAGRTPPLAELAPARIDLTDRKQGACGLLEVETEFGCVIGPRLLTKSAPRYPEEARRRRLQGNVLLRVLISAEGEVDAIDLVAATVTGVGFEESAVDRVRRWRYAPARLNNRPWAVYHVVEVQFVLP